MKNMPTIYLKSCFSNLDYKIICLGEAHTFVQLGKLCVGDGGERKRVSTKLQRKESGMLFVK